MTSSNRLSWTYSREPGHAALPVVEEDGVGGPRDRVRGGVVEDDVGRLAAELQGDLLEVPGRRVHDQLPDLGRPGEGDLVNHRVGGEGGPGRLAVAGDDVDHAVRDARLGDQAREADRGQRRLLGRLHHHGVARGQRRPELPRGHQQREVPGDDLADDADRLAQRVGVEVRARHVGHRDVDRVALDLGRPAGHVVEQVRRQRDVRAEGDGVGLAVVQALELRQLLGVLEDQVADAPDDPAALRRRDAAPGALVEGLPGGPDGAVDVLGIALGHVRQRLAGGRVGRLERLARGGVDPLPVDEQLAWGGGELFDGAVHGDSHEWSSPRRAARAATPLQLLA